MKQSLSPLQKALNMWAGILIVWSIYRTKLSLPQYIDEFIAKPLIFVVPVYIYISHIEKKGFLQDIWFTFKNISKNILIPLGIGTILTVAAFLASIVKYGAIPAQTLFSAGDYTLPMIIVLSLATSISEEILSRGFILKRIFEDSKNVYSASFLASVLFLLLHIPILFTNYKLGGNELLLFLGSDFILSMVNSLIFLDRKSIIPPILIHAFYNLAVLLYV